MRLTFDGLATLHRSLVDRLRCDDVSLTSYATEWDELLSFAGWTVDDYLAELDLRWDAVASSSTRPFEC